MNPESAAPFVQYRCVCGADVSVNPRSGGKCASCDRFISPQMLIGDVTQTIVLGTELTPGKILPLVDDHEMIGQSLEYFRIVGRLGQGGMGAVYRALDESLQRFVALKVISNQNETADAKHVERLLQEARAQARVNHANVVHIYYVSRQEDKMPFLAMELIDGPTLAERMRNEPLTYKEVVEIGLQVVEALRQSARFDIVHGDIKPSNILLADGKIVKLSDFGLSQRISTSDQNTGTIAGTPSYMAPELFDGDTPNVQTDQYALGVMLFEMTFGRMPYSFETSSLQGAMAAHRQASIEFPETWPNNLPIVWRTILQQLLAKDPKDRFESFDEVGSRLFRARPNNVRTSGRIVRGMAWIIDSLICLAIVGMCVGLIGLLKSLIDNNPGKGWIVSLCGGVSVLLALAVPAMIGFVQSKWGTTPGKKLMQIRIVDEHGLRPNRWRLALRSVPQFLPCWAMLYSEAIEIVIPEFFANSLAGVLVSATAVDAAVAMFARRGRSIHDWFFNTQVVLDDGRGD